MKVNSKNSLMYTALLQLCEKHDIKILAGNVVAYELLNNVEVNKNKDFFFFTEGMEKFSEVCETLEELGYQVKITKRKSGRMCKITCPDVLATTINKTMNESDIHCPVISIRELVKKGSDYEVVINYNKGFLKLDTGDDLVSWGYKDSIVYMKEDASKYINDLYGKGFEASNLLTEYSIFSENCDPEAFFIEARNRGILSEERVKRYKEHKDWKSSDKKEIEQKYKKYVNVLLGLNS